MIAPARPEHIPALKRLWKLCFGDPDSYIDFIFSEWQRDMLVLCEGGEPAAMLSVQAFSLRLGGESVPAAYLYAVATDPARQSKGLGTALLLGANELLRERGFRCAALVPASGRLFDYYGKRGYENAFWLCRAEVPAAEIKPVPGWMARQTAFSAVAGHVDRFYDGLDAAFWPRDYLGFIGAESRFGGGGVFLLCKNGGEMGYAVVYRHGDNCVVKELAVRQQDIPGAMSALHAVFGAGSYRLDLPPGTDVPFKNRVLPFGMLQWYDRNDKPQRPVRAYLVHALD